MSKCEHLLEFLEYEFEETSLGCGWVAGRNFLVCENCSEKFLLSEHNLSRIFNSIRSSHLKLKEEVRILSETIENLKKQINDKTQEKS